MERPTLLGAAEAGDEALLDRLLDDPSSGGPDAPGPGGLTALMRAAARGRGPCVALLLARGAAVDAADAFGNTALMYACARGQGGCAETLLAAGARRDHANKYGLGPADWAKWPKDSEAFVARLGL
jgi:ankyrin repeat protein